MLALTLPCCQTQPARETNTATPEPANADSGKRDTLSRAERANQRRDTIYRTLTAEEPLRRGYYFGMSFKEWNKMLAAQASDGTLRELSEEDSYHDGNSWLIRDAYKGYIPAEEPDAPGAHRTGYTIRGLFIHPAWGTDTVELFRIGQKLISDPVLVGIQLDCDIPYSYYEETIKAMVGKDDLRYLAGPNPMLPDERPLAESDFSDPVAERLGRMVKKQGGQASDEHRALKESYTRTLFQNPRFYAVIEVKETLFAEVTRDADYRIMSMTNAWRRYTLRQQIFSKKQSGLDIVAYMTPAQEESYRNTLKTKELIQKAQQAEK